jgi:hypothetical protein
MIYTKTLSHKYRCTNSQVPLFTGHCFIDNCVLISPDTISSHAVHMLVVLFCHVIFEQRIVNTPVYVIKFLIQCDAILGGISFLHTLP